MIFLGFCILIQQLKSVWQKKLCERFKQIPGITLENREAIIKLAKVAYMMSPTTTLGVHHASNFTPIVGPLKDIPEPMNSIWKRDRWERQ